GGDGGNAADDEGGAARLIRAQQDLLGGKMLFEGLARGVHFRMLSDACVSVNRLRNGILGGAMASVRAPRFPSRLSSRPLTAVVTVALLLTSACVSYVPRYQVL